MDLLEGVHMITEEEFHRLMNEDRSWKYRLMESNSYRGIEFDIHPELCQLAGIYPLPGYRKDPERYHWIVGMATVAANEYFGPDVFDGHLGTDAAVFMRINTLKFMIEDSCAPMIVLLTYSFGTSALTVLMFRRDCSAVLGNKVEPLSCLRTTNQIPHVKEIESKLLPSF